MAHKSFLSAEEVCKIITECSKNGVSMLKYGCLEVNFGAHSLSVPGPANPAQNSEEIIQEQQKVEKNALLEEEIKTREEQIAELLVTDPLAAEELMAQGDLEPSDGDSDNAV